MVEKPEHIEHAEANKHASDEVTIGGRRMNRADIFKFAGLIVFAIVVGIIVFSLWPYVKDLFEEGGLERLIDRLQNAGPTGVLLLLGMQFLQIIVAFIPGEVVQLAAGLMYGPWLGTIIILFGCVCSSAIIYQLVHKLGAPFVQGMVSTDHLAKFRAFEDSGRLDVVVFILFLIPGMPKDVFTYLVPLTHMTLKRFLILTTLGRIPGVIGSTYAASGFASGNILGSAIVLGMLAVIALLAIIFHKQLMNFLSHHSGMEPPAKSEQADAESDEGRA